MLTSSNSKRLALLAACAVTSTNIVGEPASAQKVELTGGADDGVVCTLGSVIFIGSDGDCDIGNDSGPLDFPDGLDAGNATFDSTFQSTVFDGGTVQFNGTNVAFSGSTTFNSIVSFVGPPVTFETAVSFDSVIDTTGIDNSGAISTDVLLATGVGTANLVIGTAITVLPGAMIDLGGNIIHGIAAGVAPTDAVNVAQLLAATSGITTDIAALEANDAIQDDRLDAIDVLNIAQDGRLTAVEGVNVVQDNRLTTLEAESHYVDINSDGPPASATGADAIAIGEAAIASATDSLAIGRTASATGANAIAIGAGASATGSVAVGAGASAALGGAAFGDLAVATGSISSAVGSEATATNTAATAIGSQAIASGLAATALGHNSDATATGATAVGVSAQATQNFSTAVGRIANASAIGATALGNNAQATAANSVALGQNSLANQANTVSVGAVGAERRIVNVAAGTSATDAVNLGQLDGLGSSLGARIDLADAGIATLFDLQRRDRKDMKQGVAAAIAIANAPMPSEPGRVSYAVNGSTFRGEYAVGGSLMYRLPTTNPMAINVGISHAGGKNTGARVGIAGEF